LFIRNFIISFKKFPLVFHLSARKCGARCVRCNPNNVLKKRMCVQWKQKSICVIFVNKWARVG
jgi:hypothetical protein